MADDRDETSPPDEDLLEYERLVDHLNAHGFEAIIESLERIAVRVRQADGTPVEAAILMTPYEWSQDVLGVNYADSDLAFEHVIDRLRVLDHARRYLVYNDYSLSPSVTPSPSSKTLQQRRNKSARGQRP